MYTVIYIDENFSLVENPHSLYTTSRYFYNYVRKIWIRKQWLIFFFWVKYFGIYIVYIAINMCGPYSVLNCSKVRYNK